MTVPAGSVLSRWAALDELLAALPMGAPCLRADGLWGSSRALVVAALRERTGRPILLLTPGPSPRHRMARDTAFFVASIAGAPAAGDDGEHARVLEFPSGTGTSWRGTRHREPDAERALCCRRLLDGDAVVVVATPSGLSEPVPPPSAFRSRTFTLTGVESSDREILLELLKAAGYERVETVM
jgi:transcription-repair coupling factor (superfamily II helicase)